MDSGAVAAGAAVAGEVDPEAFERYRLWLEGGNAAGMDYLRNHLPLRRDPRLLLQDAKTIICCAFPYGQAEERDPQLGHIATYAYGDDYHDAIRRRLGKAIESFDTLPGTVAEENGLQRWRICIDSAPVMERYWARVAGVGSRCANGMIHVEGYGQKVFLAEIITTLPPEIICDLSGQEECESPCDNCGACRRSCPGKALGEEGTINARRCISYLSIEHRGDWDAEGEEVMSTPAGKECIYGCDTCVMACHLNRECPPSTIPEFKLRASLKNLSRKEASQLSQEEFSRIFKGSAIKRTKLTGLLRNCGGRKGELH